MKMLMLNVVNKDVKMVETNTLADYYNLIGCDYVDIIHRRIGDVEVEIVLDDEGVLVEDPKPSGISIDGTPMLVGSLVIASGRVTDDGELTELTEEEVDEIMDNVATITTSVYTEPYPAFVEVDY